ncbi:Alpha/Beta hydrolase protein [Crepidotus variabilis]|uniref:Carboxylic ester hydrolase n=1 Tax=Crepidotus variabilis TaxID=179855 RepID=A0A9P6ECR0_9AGAR|nr:Alpha/Beta hydrolase protein [Crepidotus variabilis]
MVALFLAILSALLTPTLSAPAGISIPHVDPSKILCRLPILQNIWITCPSNGKAALNRQTSLGTANGVEDPNGAYRFAVRYGNAARFQPSSVVTSWDLPNGSNNASALPLACPQPDIDASAYSEDCLSMILYVPPSLTVTSQAPTLVWIHGGSFIVGSSSGAGLDGSKLAIATNSIVAVIQYRLGAPGFLAPNGQTNLAVKDVVTGLNFLKKVLPYFGGSPSKVTLAGQSAGANMIRALLAVPSASSLFRSAILQSDPMNFGFLSPTTYSALKNDFVSRTGCSATDNACLNGLSVAALISASMATFNAGLSISPAAGQAQPIRPVLDGSYIAAPLDSTGTFPPQTKPLLITTVAQEAGWAIYKSFSDPLPEFALPSVCEFSLGSDRTATVLNQQLYQPIPNAGGDPDARAQLQLIGTDQLWKCSGWTFTRSWVQNGGTAYVGQYVVGSTYPGNELVPFCTQSGVVCHQDDIQIVFGTVENPTSAQSALITETQSRYKNFLANGNPNPSGLSAWPAATSSNVHPKLLGGTGEATVGACDPSFWGSSVQYDYQYYHNY